MGDAMMRLRGNSGFTMLELLTVVAVLAIGAAVTAFSLNKMLPDLRLKAAVRDLKSDLNLAKLVAIRNNTFVSILFDTDNNNYTIFQDDGSGGGTADDFVRNGAEPLIKTVDIPKNVSMYDASFDGVGPKFQFNALGVSDAGTGHVYMSNNKGNYRGVTVVLSGKVQIQTSADGAEGNWKDVD
jgi:prepilin-type N-terminal cleavage/methylation domain-containing protein